VNTKAKTAAYGIAGLALAGIMILSGATLGVLGPNRAFNPSSLGSVSIALTDPPSVPTGVTAIYFSYSSLGLHVEGLGDSGWVTVAGPGTVETLHLVNLTKTLSTSGAPSGRYNLLVFNITSAKVLFNGVNYSARISSGRLVVPIVGGLDVNSSKPAVALLDIQPTVLNLGTSSPDFVIATGARALQFPEKDVGGSLTQVGHEEPIATSGWLHEFENEHPDNVTVSKLSLSASSFSFTASNLGTDSVSIRIVILSTASTGTAEDSAFSSLSSSIVFAVSPDGSLHLLTAGAAPEDKGGAGDFGSALGSVGYSLSGGASQTFSFSGTISTFTTGAGVVSGTTYYTVVIGSHALSVVTVKSA
jgi:hypothetical protein